MAEYDRAKWDDRYSKPGPWQRPAPGWLSELEGELPASGQGLDVAAGAGRVAVWLARRGLEVQAVDISPVGLALAREAARDERLKVKTIVRDLEKEALPEGPFAVIACFHYKQADLYAPIKERLAPGGVVLIENATVHNLERHERPSQRWLVEPNELLRAAEGLEVFYYREGWLGDQHLARLGARKR
ncbi:MAG: class I SAM-dependent methyltransferase [Sandaracinaceae bacterium]|nr:class I SAM-dependent methyltransferase [Sandaracinaceae bacterium]